VRPAFLDVNLLVALFDPDHIHHETAHDWFSDNASDGWATCPMTENGFVPVLANPAYGREAPAARNRRAGRLTHGRIRSSMA
jgi:predicted nucleic acid-binding protein